MKTLFIILVFFAVFINLFAQEAGSSKKSNFCITGIKGKFAVINGEIVQEGDEIKGAKIVDIQEDGIELNYKDENFFLKLREGCEVGTGTTTFPHWYLRQQRIYNRALFSTLTEDAGEYDNTEWEFFFNVLKEAENEPIP
jgi:hypothetical protein